MSDSEWYAIKRGDVLKTRTGALRVVLDVKETANRWSCPRRRMIGLAKMRGSWTDPCSWTAYTRSDADWNQLRTTGRRMRIDPQCMDCPRHGNEHMCPRHRGEG